MFNLFALLSGNMWSNMSDKIAGWQVCVLPSVCRRNADPLIRHHHTFPKPRGGAGRASLNIHRSRDSTAQYHQQQQQQKERESNRHQTEIVGTGISLMPITAAATGVSRLCANFVLSTAQSSCSQHICCCISSNVVTHGFSLSDHTSVPLIHLPSFFPIRREGGSFRWALNKGL